MRWLVFIYCFFILQPSVGAGEKATMKPAVEFIVKYAEYAKLGAGYIPVAGPYIKGFIIVGQTILCLVEKCLSQSEKAEEERKEILAELGIMGQKIDDNYNSLKSFTVEHDFYTKFVVPAEAQFDFLRGVIKYRTRESIDLFTKHYEDNHPVFGVVEISKRLAHHNVTNPIVSAMRADPLRTTATFRKWTACIHNLYTTMHISYLFYEGLHGRNATENDQVFDKLSEATERLNNFLASYQNDYWPHAVARAMHDTADNNPNLSNIAKSRFLKHELQKIRTDDSFLVLVYDHVSGSDDHAIRVTNLTEKVILHEKSSGTMVVYRSFTAKNRTNSASEDLAWDTDWSSKRYCSGSNSGFGASADAIFKEIPDAYFVAMIRWDKNIAVRSVGNTHRRAWFAQNYCFRMKFIEIVPVHLFVAPH